MKAKKKRVGTKAQIRAEKERDRKIATAIFLTIILLIIPLSAYFTYNYLSQPPVQIINPTSQLKAAIVDQAVDSPVAGYNPVFVETAKNILKTAGYTVDYYPGKEVTVEFFRGLPTYDYGLIILRVHSSAVVLEGKEFVETPVSFFTSESYSRNKYVWEQLTDQLLVAAYSMPEAPYYFGITPKFVTDSMKGNFHDTMIIMMGCEGLSNTKMAEVFIQKGAKVYISWNGSISASHTDQATVQLLQHLVTEKQTIKQAIDNTMREVGPDPVYNSLLLYYPLGAGSYRIENTNSKQD